MRAEVTVGLTGMSVLLQDPSYAGFAPEAQAAALLSFTGIACLGLLVYWSERWPSRRREALRQTAPKHDTGYEMTDEEAQNVVHSTAV